MRIVWLRRGIQAASLALFLILLISARGQDQGEPSGWLGLYFDLDPLVLLGTWLATHKLASLSLLALATLAVTVLLGRVFCGWLCPLGVLHNSLSWLRSRRGRRRQSSDEFSRWQRAKYCLLVALAAMALFGAHWIGIFDPASLLYRSVTTAVLPALQFAVEDGGTAIYESDPGLGPVRLSRASEPVYGFFREHVFHERSAVFEGGALIFLILIAALLLNLLRPRFWCRYVCPLGALLGLFARRTSLRLAATGECGSCRLCSLSCPAAAQPDRVGQWLPAECFGCWNCVAACDRDAIDFHFQWPWHKPQAGRVDLKRRAILGSLAAGIGGLFLFRLPTAARARTFNPELIRPPGALPERDFLARCVQCGLCMQTCPPNGLHPALHQAGLEGLWSPRFVFSVGYCEYECRLCGQVCPTGAIAKLELPAKKQVKMGLAAIDTTRCLPYAYGRECIVCEEHCPIPNKAIYFVEEEVSGRDGSRIRLKRPRVDLERCTGCGICENKCPFKDLPAIRVTSAGETRHPDNQPALPGAQSSPLGYGA